MVIFRIQPETDNLMHSRVAELTRARQAEREAALTIEERVALWDAVAQLGIELYMSAHDVSREEARRRLRLSEGRNDDQA